MSKLGAFDIIGPRMIGPSSSHTAGAAKIAQMAWKMANKDVVRADITLYGSFAETGKGHGTDKALAAGLLGMESDDKRLRYSLLLAEEAGIELHYYYSQEEREYPNSVKIRIESTNGDITEVEGESIGGGSVNISKLNGIELKISGDYPTLVLRYVDELGVISRVSALLAEKGIFIVFMRVFRQEHTDDACMVVETDRVADENILVELYSMATSMLEVRLIL